MRLRVSAAKTTPELTITFAEPCWARGGTYKLGSIHQSGSKDVVALVSSTPCAIGYSGMGYKDDTVKWPNVKAGDDQEGVAPSVESASNGTYPIARPLYIYSGDGSSRNTLTGLFCWQAEKVVLDLGYVPLSHSLRAFLQP